MNAHRWRLRAVALACTLAATIASAQEEPRTWFQLGAQAAHLHTATRDSLDLNHPGTLIDSESMLGLPSSTTVWGLGFGRRIGSAWRVEVDYQRSDRSSRILLSQDTALDGYTFVAGTPLAVNMKIMALRVNAGWSFVREPGLEAGLIVGGLYQGLTRVLDGTALSYDGISTVPQHSDRSDGAPMAVIGAYAEGSIAPQFAATGRAEVALGTRKRLEGLVWWRPVPAFSLGLGYQWVRSSVDITWGVVSGSTRFRFDDREDGPRLVTQLAF